MSKASRWGGVSRCCAYSDACRNATGDARGTGPVSVARPDRSGSRRAIAAASRGATFVARARVRLARNTRWL